MKRAFPLVLSLLVSVASLAQSPPNLILVNGRVTLPNSPDQFAEAIAIKADRIVAVGTNAEITALAPQATRIDLQQHLVIPGINDAHVHFEVLPPAFILSTTPDSLFPEVTAAIAGAIDESPADVVIFATIGTPVFLDPNATRQALDAVAPGRQIILRMFTGHGAILSTAALTALGVSVANPPIGGKVEKDAGGAATGRVFEYAQYAFERKICDSTDDQSNIDALRILNDQALRLGITTLQIMPTMAALRFELLVRQARPRVRIRVMRIPITDNASLHLDDNRGGNIGAVKWLLDGTPIERGAALRDHYAGTGLSGTENFTEQQLRIILTEAIRGQEQPLLHAAGDRTIQTVLKVMLQMALADWPTRRLRIEHGDGMQRDLMRDAAAFGVTVVQNPTHFPFRNFYPKGDYMLLKTLLARHIHLAFGSDGVLDPYVNIQLAVTHPQVPDEKLTVAEALAAYTSGSAFAEKVDDKGTIAPGQLADLAVLSKNLFTTHPEDMPGTESILTIVGGKIAFDAGILP
jgi:predicted amidohydrolase YtcJ